MSGSKAGEEAVLEAAARVARADSEHVLSEARSRAVLARVEAELAARPAPHRWTIAPRRWALVPLVPALAVVAVIVLRGGDSRPPPSMVDAAVAELRYATGSAWVSSSERDAPESLLSAVVLTAGERADLAIPAGRVVLTGPARARFATDALLLDEGRALLAIAARQPDQPTFVVRTPVGEVRVDGAVLEVARVSGRALAVTVEEGEAEVRRDTDVVRVGAHRQSVEPSREEAAERPIGAELGAPWWAGEGARARLAIAGRAGAEVWIDGRAIGRAPLLVAWPVGPAVIERRADGYRPARAQVELRAGQVARVDEELEPEAAGSSPGAAEQSTGPAVRAVEAGAAERAPGAHRKPDPSPPDAPTLARARAHLEAGRCASLDRELVPLVPRLATDGARASAELLAAECWLRRGDRAEAATRYARIVERYPQTTSAEPAQFEVAKLAEERGQRAAALSALDAYLARYPDGRFAEAARLRRCELLVRAARLSEAQACVDAFRARHPEAIRSHAALLLSADLARIRGQLSEAAAGYRRYLAEAPRGDAAERARFHLGEVLHALRDPGAREVLADFLARYPRSARADDVRRWYGELPR